MMKDIESRMKKTISVLKEDLTRIRTGRANASLLDHLRVSYYGSDLPISQVANLSVPEPRTIVIAPWEKPMLGTIEKAILASDIGITPSNDGVIIRLTLPELTEDRRKEFVKQVKQIGEKARVAVRNIRRDANEEVKKQVKDDGLPEDESKRRQDQIQQLTDQYIAEIEHVLERKEHDILTV
ncbi:MAG: ribosome recycling factor [Zetaproteobacteria bacterium CG06_land_8_20_14_3_00_59_53]|nr:MAG: ribosome recycling factor [Zetaproteobacteria bacterium CG2_30_59_37]PIO90430.1 MAG: ribosome recycling factor [Zetaproteobacteria bacterium CG23_combo_of_CG06-09_8_20_14_all_59_86]PIQ65901.1 MAG: ribosome recycling factor [Zetaproteobacteria bacterium CG11_big_fil_rev_8_21_14_0_20_59_439]PIU71381.1 MAG: ribosome recycling factor [Zetaproteobacteria bacterium CG06_land_8_20_14_3_00_59_53]PIU97637.1 MAG: ribosome recycling factor [Zetaproteobacteria bacterium CG03_land_8_20_14_0_80_59_51